MYRVTDDEGNVKLTGRSRAAVIDNRDPENRGRIQVDHPLLGETTWIAYLNTPGNFSVPSIGDIVYIEADTGEFEYPIAWGNLVKGTDDSPEIPTEFKRDIPTNRGFYTPGGHLIELDDGEADITDNPDDTQFTEVKRGIRITSKAQNKIHISEEKDNEYMLIEGNDGTFIKIDMTNGELKVESIGKTVVTTAGDREDIVGGDHTEDVTGNKTVTVSGDTKIKTADMAIDSPSTSMTGTLNVDGDVTAKANAAVTGDLDVTGNSSLGGGTPLLLSTAQFVGTGNMGAPVISSLMSGSATTVTGS